MSKDIFRSKVSSANDRLYVTSFWGGPRGRMLQFTPSGKYAQLDPEEVERLIKVLTAWVAIQPIDPVDDE